jgi:hypothetical protein
VGNDLNYTISILNAIKKVSLVATLAAAVVLIFSSVALAQTGQQGQAVQQAGTNQDGGTAAARPAPSPTINLPFDPHDFSGIWLFRGGGGFTSSGAPAMTPWAQARFDAAKPGLDAAGPRAQPLGNDPIMICDPVGYPRILSYGAYPVEFIQTPGRVTQFFDFFYTHRTIYTDGRKLPDDPEPTWYGYSVGTWEGDTLVVRSNGFNGRAWLDNVGHPYSEDAKLEERYRRVDHDTINITMTLTDPKAYTKLWATSGTMALKWSPKEVMREDVCAPSDEEKYKEEVREPAGHK